MENNDIGVQIKRMRLNKNLTQQELAEELSVTSPAVSNWETGKRLPSIEDLKRIASFFNVSLSIFDLNRSHQASIEHTDGFQPNQTVQVIDRRFSFQKGETICLFAAITITTLSVFFPSNIDLILYFTGISLFLAFGLAASYSLFCIQKNNMKHVIIPAHYPIHYEHAKDKKTLVKSYAFTRNLTFVLLIVCVFNMILLIWFNRFYQRSIINTLSAMLGIIAILVYYYRFIETKKSNLYHKAENYHKVPKNLRNQAYVISLFIDLFILYAFVLTHLLLKKTSGQSIYLYTIIGITLLCVTGSFVLLSRHQSHIKGFSLYYNDTTGQQRQIR